MGQKVSPHHHFFYQYTSSVLSLLPHQDHHHIEKVLKNEGTRKGDCNTSALALGKGQKEEAYATTV
jgi:hypothetical protein